MRQLVDNKCTIRFELSLFERFQVLFRGTIFVRSVDESIVKVGVSVKPFNFDISKYSLSFKDKGLRVNSLYSDRSLDEDLYPAILRYRGREGDYDLFEPIYKCYSQYKIHYDGYIRVLRGTKKFFKLQRKLSLNK